jgi:HSP20 family molecular chaperone IbpA
MPENIDEKKIDANYSNGILHVVIGKKKVESPKAVKSIPVK